MIASSCKPCNYHLLSQEEKNASFRCSMLSNANHLVTIMILIWLSSVRNEKFSRTKKENYVQHLLILLDVYIFNSCRNLAKIVILKKILVFRVETKNWKETNISEHGQAIHKFIRNRNTQVNSLTKPGTDLSDLNMQFPSHEHRKSTLKMQK